MIISSGDNSLFAKLVIYDSTFSRGTSKVKFSK